MDQSQQRRTRLAQLLDLAQTYRGGTRRELARVLGRDPTKLVPGSGIPKLDLVVDLSRVLDWSVDDVVSYLWKGDSESMIAHDGPDDFESLDEQARAAHGQGAYTLMIDLARKAFDTAETGEQRARACNREAGGWDGVGRYADALKAVQRGLNQSPVSAEFRRMLQANLANAYYSLWSLVEARSIAGDMLAWYRANPPETDRDRKSEAGAHYVAGHTLRRMVGSEPERAAEHAAASRVELEYARDRMRELAVQLDNQSFEGIANTCHGGLIEVDVVLGRRDATDAMKELTDGLDNVAAGAESPVGDWLESYAWWCIFGCDIALRHLTDEKELQQHMAVFTMKADEIADRLDNWSIRERVFTMEHSRWERAVGCTGFDIPRVVDEEDVRIITGTMARFPTFHETGWRILRSARVIRSS